MSITIPTKWKPEKAVAIDLLVSNPEALIKDVAEKAGVTKATIHNWLKDPEFVEVFYQKYMITFGSKLPTVLNSMIREAEAGNVQAGRLILEHSGKLIKRVEVANHKSPFEKFLTNTSDSVQEIDIIDAEIEVLPQRPEVPTPTPQIDLRAKNKKNKKRREARQWRERAERVGIPKPKRGRQTPANRKAWQEKIVAREKALNV